MAMLHSSGELLMAGGTVHRSVAVVELDGGRWSCANMTVTVRDLGAPNAEVAAAGVYQLLARQNDVEVLPVTTAAGPAVVRVAAARTIWSPQDASAAGDVRDDEASLNPAADSSGHDGASWSVQVECWVPVSAGKRVAVFVLSTTEPRDLQFWQSVLADIVNTVTPQSSKEAVSGLPADREAGEPT
ncbi:hypothetical protein [Allostreptomyces psammosilenae]|uniref:Uncharacterized protein n=1 Tax=Allostreptomyces psammosilenae TaxID=1892865 RepID=A0A852ZXN0_9ACTN|nr:hypothetical protein [Allostreptomyces psammosilenae]NYI06517.1 hypothetical protein [Allostreptomyces psammosilenae]